MMRTAVVLSVFSLAAGFSAPALAQLSSSSNSPVDVTADQLEAQPQQCLAIYRGNVEALQGTSRLRTDLLNIYAKPGAAQAQPAPGGGPSSKCGALTSENRTKSFPSAPNAAPAIPATPASSNNSFWTCSAERPVSSMFTQA